MKKEKFAKDLKVGDETPWYRILAIRVENGKVIAKVQFWDGGQSERIWDDPDTKVPINQ